MATTPTSLPIPSEDPSDLKFNAGKFDEVMSSDAHYYTDRFGVQRWTIAGFEYTAKEAIRAYGYITMDSFEDGATLTLPNQVLRYEATGEYYRWDGAFPKVVDAGSTPTSTGGIGLGAWISVGDASLRTDLASTETWKGGELVAVKKTGTNTTPTTVAKKLNTFIDFATDYCGGPITGQPTLTTLLQQAIIDAFNEGISEIRVVGDFYIDNMVLLYPGVTLVGGGYDRTLIRATSGFPAGGTMIRGIRPAGWVPGAHNMGITDIYLVGRAAKDINAIDINDASYPRFTRVRMDLFNNGISFNKWIDDTRVTVGGVTTYPNAHSTDAGGQSYFGVVEQCYAGNCIRCVDFNGIVNRWTFISNTWTSSELAYNFSNPRGVYETNTFMTCNIEGVGSAFEWFFSVNSPYHNVWINTSIDNGNPAITCQAKDGGRQTFIGLALFPYGNPSLVNWINVNPNGYRSTVLGTDNGELLPENQLKTQVREEFHTLAGIFNKLFVNYQLTTSIGPNATYTIAIPFTGLKQGAAISWSLQKLYPQLVIQAASTTAGAVNFQMVNLTNTTVNVDTQVYLSPINKSFL